MRPGMLTWLVSLYFLIAAASSPRDQQQFRNQQQADETLPEMKAVSTVLRQEPTCDELRAMWRFSKRQSRAAENSNEIPTYRDPFSYNVWDEQATLRSVGGPRLRRPLVYGRLVHGVPGPRFLEPTPERVRAFEEVARLFGTSMVRSKGHGRRRPTSTRQVGGHGSSQNLPQTGSFQHLKELIQTERARELHEQKMMEENVVRDRYRNMMIPDQSSSTGLIPYGQREQDDYYKAGGGRGRGQGDGVVFPDVLAPSKYEPPPPPAGYYRTANYMPRPYPDPMNVPEQRMLSVYEGQRSPRSPELDPFPLLGNEVGLYIPQSSPSAEPVHPDQHHQLNPTYSKIKAIKIEPCARCKQIPEFFKEYQRLINKFLWNYFYIKDKTSTAQRFTELVDFLKKKFPFSRGKFDNDLKERSEILELTKLNPKLDNSLFDINDLDNVASIVPKKGDFILKDRDINDNSIFNDIFLQFYPQVKTQLKVERNSKYIPQAENENYVTETSISKNEKSKKLYKPIGKGLLFGKDIKYENNISPSMRKVIEIQGTGENLYDQGENMLGKGKAYKFKPAIIKTKNTPNENGISPKKLNMWKYLIIGEDIDEKGHFIDKLKNMQLSKINQPNDNLFSSSIIAGSKGQFNLTDAGNQENDIGK